MKIHIAQPGDTLAKLARKYRVDLGKLVEANSHVKSEELLEAGSKIRIPAKGIRVSPNKAKVSKTGQGRQESNAQADPAAVQAIETVPERSDLREPLAHPEEEAGLPPQFHRHNHWEEAGDAERSPSESEDDFDSELDFESDEESDEEFFRFPYGVPNPIGFYRPFAFPYSYFPPSLPIPGIYPAGWFSPYLPPSIVHPAALAPQPFPVQPAAVPFPPAYFDLNEWMPEWDEIE